MECVATCRPGLEGVLESEISRLGGESVRPGKRSVHFSTDQGGLYRMNMGLRTAIQVLVPIRSFNARDYKLLYFQARRTNWHQYFTPGKTLRIDVNGSSGTLRNTQYVVHRIKDGIVDTFRKLSDGQRPSIDREAPEIHVVAHLSNTRVTLCLDSSGTSLFKRGYRTEHGGAPIKEDLAAGILMLAEAEKYAGVVDPMCGSGTFLFEAWMLLNGIAPNLERTFAFQNWLDYDPGIFEREREKLRDAGGKGTDWRLTGIDSDPECVRIAEQIRKEHFPGAPIRFIHSSFQNCDLPKPGGLMVTNPPYGKRLGEESELPELYRDLGYAAKRMVPGGQLSLFTANRKAARQVRLKSDRGLTLFNGGLEGVLYEYSLRSE